QLTSDPELKRWIDNKLRVELRLLSRKLKDTTLDGRNLTTEFTHPENRALLESLTLQWAYNLTPEKLKSLFSQHVGGLDMSEQI
ncbi:hypothetical protein, partial [Ventosimonas gracilis]|uniref:hypothetical protein n=1 Tax=Ventosimonas gracilis TaxID=1680762 RepID=UPI001872E017